MKRSEIAFSIALVPLDFLGIFAAAVGAYFFRFQSAFTDIRPIIFDLDLERYLSFTIGISLIWLLIFASLGLYTMRANRTIAEEIGRVFAGSTLGFVAIILALFFQRELFQSRFILLAAWIFSMASVSLIRLAVRLIQHQALKKGWGTIRLLILGQGPVATTLVEAMRRQLRWGFEPIRVAIPINTKPSDFEASLASAVSRYHPDGLLVADPRCSHTILSLAREFALDHHLEFRYAADPLATRKTHVRTYLLAGIPLVELKRTPLEGWGRVIKRMTDVILSTGLIIIFSPLLLVIALLILFTSGRPILWSRLDDGAPVRRVGEGGKPFRYFKFRTMRMGTHHLRYSHLATHDIRPGPLVKIKNDPRVTPIGRLLRRWSLDELPELFLVWWGSMSLVGPRPHLPEEVEKYQQHHRRVLAVKSGMSGLAQISGREQLSFEEEATLDEYYIEHWSPGLDLQIILKTPWVVLMHPAM